MELQRVILVSSDSKGDRLLFRYPYVQQNDEENGNKVDKKKKNPYSIAVSHVFSKKSK